MIREMLPSDAERVLTILDCGIQSRSATFETQVPDWTSFDVKHLPCCRLVWDDGETVMGWTALTPFSARVAFRGVAELSIYLSRHIVGQGVGSQLMDALIQASEANGIWSLIARIFPENAASLALHRKFGFRQVGYLERLARHDGKWRDVIVMQRRSTVVGID